MTEPMTPEEALWQTAMAEQIERQNEPLRAIEFARTQDAPYDTKQFLQDWAHVDLSHWPEYRAALKGGE